MQRGRVKFINKRKDFGFITMGTGPDIFFHINQRHADETDVPKEGQEIYFETRPGPKGPVAQGWRLSLVAPSIDPDQDRREGFRPGVMIALRCIGSDELLLGRRRGTWTLLHSLFHPGQTIDAADWMYSWGVPQGGIELGETCEQAIARELDEELGPEWVDYIVGIPKFLFKDRASFPLKKDGRNWEGKTLYSFLVEISGVPDAAFDWMYGNRQDEFWTFPTPAFEGGVQLYPVPEAIQMIRHTQRGGKGTQLVRLCEMVQAT